MQAFASIDKIKQMENYHKCKNGHFYKTTESKCPHCMPSLNESKAENGTKLINLNKLTVDSKIKLLGSLEEFMLELKEAIIEGKKLESNFLRGDLERVEIRKQIHNWHLKNIELINNSLLDSEKEIIKEYKKNMTLYPHRTFMVGDEIKLQMNKCLSLLFHLPFDVI